MTSDSFRTLNLILRASFILALSLARSIIPHAQEASFAGAVQAGGADRDAGSGIAVDRDGNTYITGAFTGTAEFAETELSARGDSDFFLAKYDHGGGLIWVKQGGGPGADGGRTIALDAAGHIYITGSLGAYSRLGVAATAAFDSLTLTNTTGSDTFVAKYNAAGEVIWAQAIAADCRSIAVDVTGNVYVAGGLQRRADLGSGATAVDEFRIVIAKYDAFGSLRWIRLLGGDVDSLFPNQAYGIAADSSGDVYVTGGIGMADIFVAKYDGAGNQLWIQQTGVDQVGWGLAIAVDGFRNSYVTGWLIGTAAFGDTILTSAAKGTAFLAKYDGTGSLLWVKTVGEPDERSGYNSGKAITVDPEGNSYVAGVFFGKATFDHISLASIGERGVFVAKYDSAGSLRWVKKAGNAGLGLSNAIAVDSAGTAYLTGDFTGIASFDGARLGTRNKANIFLARITDPSQPPRLQITQSDGALFVLWPRSAPGFVLEAADNLAYPATWNLVSDIPTLPSDQNTVSVELSSGSKFFRLRKL